MVMWPQVGQAGASPIMLASTCWVWSKSCVCSGSGIPGFLVSANELLFPALADPALMEPVSFCGASSGSSSGFTCTRSWRCRYSKASNRKIKSKIEVACLIFGCSTLPAGSKRVNVNRLTYSSNGTPYCSPSDTEMLLHHFISVSRLPKTNGGWPRA